MTRHEYVENITLLARLYERNWLTYEQFKKLRETVKKKYKK